MPDADRRWMRRALVLAERGWERVAPNPLVGAVVVREGQVVGEGWHAEYGGPHAEVKALEAAGEAARGATIYVTLEPCDHHGKTPPCTEGILAAGIARVVYAADDPDPAAGRGAVQLRARGVEVKGGVEEQAAMDLNARFFHAFGPAGASRPWTVLKLAMSLDGRVADREGRSGWITGEAARAEVHRQRAGVDAVAVGIGTALHDDPRLTVRSAVTPRVSPARVIFDRHLRLPEKSQLVRSAHDVPVWAVCRPDAPDARRRALQARGVRILPADGLREALASLREAGVGSLYVEGGAALAGALLSAELVDRLDLFVAPLFLGAEGLAPFAALPSPSLQSTHRWRHLSSLALGADTLMSFSRY